MTDKENKSRKMQAQESRKQARREAREYTFCLLFETEYHTEETAEVIFARAMENAEEAVESDYVRDTYFGIMQHLDALDALIGRFANGWSTKRLSRVSRAVLRLGVYELAFVKGMPAPVAINEAVELVKKYDDVKARAFVNGVLNAVKNAIQAGEVCMTAISGSPVTSEEVVAPAPQETAETAETAGIAETAETAETAEVVEEPSAPLHEVEPVAPIESVAQTEQA